METETENTVEAIPMMIESEEYSELIHGFIHELLNLVPPEGHADDVQKRGGYIMGVIANINAGVICNIIAPGQEYIALDGLHGETRDIISNLIPQAEFHRATRRSKMT